MNIMHEQLDPLHRLICAYAKAVDRQRYYFLFAFDQRLAEILKSSSEILIAKMKLTWWRDILTMPAGERPKGEPMVAVVNELESDGANLDQLIAVVDGWESILDDFPLGDHQLQSYATGRGIGLFQFAIGDKKLSAKNRDKLALSWAYWDFARHCSDEEMRDLAFQKCSDAMSKCDHINFDRSGRPLAILCHLVASDVKKGRISPDLYRPKAAAKIIWHGITGY